MEEQQKTLYESPFVRILELKTKGIVCQSQSQVRRLDYDYEEW